MQIVTQVEFYREKYFFSEMIRNGSVIVYPTDTIYGLGCNAMLSEPVIKIRQLKARWDKPFSVIAPSKEWILENCVIDRYNKWLANLPGKYTIILKMKRKCVAKEVNIGLNTLGVRIPKHWISGIVAELNLPIITTSVNKTGSDFMTSLEDIDNDIKNSAELIIYEGEKNGTPSEIINLIKEKEIKINR
jgi:L-threonylcarbamoyladenylate synthase